jgi:hypothetical protein
MVVQVVVLDMRLVQGRAGLDPMELLPPILTRVRVGLTAGEPVLNMVGIIWQCAPKLQFVKVMRMMNMVNVQHISCIIISVTIYNKIHSDQPVEVAQYALSGAQGVPTHLLPQTYKQ